MSPVTCEFVKTSIEGQRVCRHCGMRVTPRAPVRPGSIRATCQGVLRPLSASRACAHRGPELRRVQCDTCAGRVHLKVFACAVHGACALDRSAAGVHSCAGCRDQRFPAAETPAVLLRFCAGLGDHVQFTVVLRHLAAMRPDLAIDVQCNAWCRGLFAGLARRVYSIEERPEGPYAIDHRVVIREPKTHLKEAHADSPSTKSEIFLRENLNLVPRPELCRYAPRVPGPGAQPRPFRQYALVHHQGSSWPEYKDVQADVLRPLIRRLVKLGVVPILLDWKHRSPLRHVPEVHTVGAGGGCMDAAELADLAAGSVLNVGIDSGPGHVFGCVEAPAIVIWAPSFPVGHHPLHYYGLSPNVTHLVPVRHEDLIRGAPFSPSHRQAATFFRHHYRWALYDPSRLGERLIGLVGSLLGTDAPLGASEGRDLTPAALLTAEHKVYSQNGEDGVIRAILAAVGDGNRTFAEIGVSQGEAPDGGPECNTRLLAERGWRGVWVDPRPPASVPPNVRYLAALAAPANVAGLIDAPDLLAIDIDYQDYWVLRAILRSGCRPRVLVCEYNASCGPHARLVVPEAAHGEWVETDYFGASLAALADLAARYGYDLVYCESSGNNAFFLRRDLRPPGFAPAPAQELYRPAVYGAGPAGHPVDPRKMIEVLA
jgi:hypothetical protein